MRPKSEFFSKRQAEFTLMMIMTVRPNDWVLLFGHCVGVMSINIDSFSLDWVPLYLNADAMGSGNRVTRRDMDVSAGSLPADMGAAGAPGFEGSMQKIKTS